MMKEPKLEKCEPTPVSSDDSDDEPFEDLFAGNLHRYQALKQQTTDSLLAQSPVATDDDVDLGINRVSSVPVSSRVDSEDDVDVEESRPYSGHRSAIIQSVESVLKELDPDLISPPTSPARKRSCCDDERVRWALDPIPDLDEEPEDIIINNVKCERVYGDSDDILLVTGPAAVEETKKPSLRVIVNVRLGAKLLRLPLYRDELLSTVFERAAQEANVPIDRVCLAFGEHKVTANQTPAQLQLNSADVLEFWVASPSNGTSKESEDGASDPNSVQLKFQSATRRDCVTLSVGRQQPLSMVIQKYADHKHLPLPELRFSFDGEDLNGEETAESLDLEGGECIDVFSR